MIRFFKKTTDELLFKPLQTALGVYAACMAVTFVYASTAWFVDNCVVFERSRELGYASGVIAFSTRFILNAANILLDVHKKLCEELDQLSNPELTDEHPRFSPPAQI